MKRAANDNYGSNSKNDAGSTNPGWTSNGAGPFTTDLCGFM